MADNKATNPPDGQVVPDVPSVEKPKPTSLGAFGSSITVPEAFARTARYAQDPSAYLREALGPDTFEQRKHLLFLDNEVDKDFYGGGKYRAQFVKHVATTLFGKPSGLFFITGIQAQLAAIKAHCDNAGNNRVAWSRTSHLEFAEQSAFDGLYGLNRRVLGHSEDQNPTVDEIMEVLSRPESERPAVVLLEIPNRFIGCATYSFAELEKISSACKAAGVKLHCDGARMWEVEPYYQRTAGRTFADIAALFDSIYVSLYKGLQGIAGAILAGEEDLISEAKVWQKRTGGTAITLMYEVVDDARAFNENIGSFQEKWEKMEDVQKQVLEATAKFTTDDGQRIVGFVVSPPTCCQATTRYSGFSTNELSAARDAVEQKTNVRVFEYGGAKKTIDEMRVMLSVRKSGTAANANKDDQVHPNECEWTIGSETVNLPTKVFVDAYVALCEELIAARNQSKQ